MLPHNRLWGNPSESISSLDKNSTTWAQHIITLDQRVVVIIGWKPPDRAEPFSTRFPSPHSGRQASATVAPCLGAFVQGSSPRPASNKIPIGSALAKSGGQLIFGPPPRGLTRLISMGARLGASEAGMYVCVECAISPCSSTI